MTYEEIKKLKEKVESGQGTPEEKLSLLKEINSAIDGMRQDIALLKKEKDLKDVRAGINKL